MRKSFIIILFFLSIFIIGNSKKKNLIIGAIANYNWQKIEPFFVSLYKANFQNFDCVMFVFNLSSNTLDKLNSNGIITYKFPKKYKGMKINNVRYKLYEDYLSNKLDKYNIVLHVDVRDTFFQKNFFQIYENKGSFIGFAIEDKNISEKTNAEWMKNQYGIQIYEEIKNERAICSGTIWGTADKFYELTKKIWKEIELKSPYDIKIHDQTATNFLIYYKKLFKDCMIKTDNYKGVILSLHFAKNTNLSYDSEDNLLDYNGKIKVALVHQYDRLPKLIEKVKKKYCYSSDYSFNLNSSLSNTMKANKFNISKVTSSKFRQIFPIYLYWISILFTIYIFKYFIRK